MNKVTISKFCQSQVRDLAARNP